MNNPFKVSPLMAGCLFGFNDAGLVKEGVKQVKRRDGHCALEIQTFIIWSPRDFLSYMEKCVVMP